MNTKLTLVMEPVVVAKAKDYASRQNTSVSKLVEQYLELVSKTEVRSKVALQRIAPLTASLAGAIPLRDEDAQKSAKQLIGEAKMERFE